eukprot:4588223-Pleurochrysis_carterae.AAC.2
MVGIALDDCAFKCVRNLTRQIFRREGFGIVDTIVYILAYVLPALSRRVATRSPPFSPAALASSRQVVKSNRGGSRVCRLLFARRVDKGFLESLPRVLIC